MKLLPDPKARSSPQVERACATALGVGAALIVPASIMDGQVGRQCAIASLACVVAAGPPILFQVMQSIRWARRAL